jgi:CheY-like chemotaxis protein
LQGRVLLAEDNAVNQELARAMLGKLGLEVEIADNGAAAVALAEKQGYDVVLMDCQMPVMDGFAATAALRAREKNPGRRLPIIALTANAMEGDRQQCIAAGMDDYLAKPYSLEQLEAMLRRWLAPANQTATRAPETPAAADAIPASLATGERATAINTAFLDQMRELDPTGSMGLTRKILQAFLESSASLQAQLDQALAAGDAEALRRSAHTLKSSSANVGAEHLSSLFKQLEACGREARLDEACQLAPRMREEYALAVRELRALLEEVS